MRRETSLRSVCLQRGTLALQKGLPYARMLERKYGFDHVKIFPRPAATSARFCSDEMFAQQCFVVSEPGRPADGVAVKVFPVSDAGYNPYTTVLATSGGTCSSASLTE